MSGAPELLLFLRYQVSVVGSTTPTVVLPLPVQSPTTGIQDGAPKANGGMSGAPGPAVFLRYQRRVWGSKTPMPVWPLPVQSPTTGIQPGSPYWNGAKTSGT